LPKRIYAKYKKVTIKTTIVENSETIEEKLRCFNCKVVINSKSNFCDSCGQKQVI
jgi:rRNA maturation endonuclease Nob1